ncbi:MAG: cobalamin-dependent protein [Deltaproteobacteria bacterium]
MITASEKSDLKQHYLGDLLTAKRAAALERVMSAFRNGYPIPDIYRDILQEALYEIGRLWETNQISVAEEHIATAITQYVMSNLYQHLEMSDIRRGRLVITGVQGELHQVGGNMVSDILEADGWDVMFLGVNVLPEEVVTAVRGHNADLVGISATMHINIPVVIDLIVLLKKEFADKAPRILLGGRAFSELSVLSPGMEECIFARDLHEALEVTRAIVSKGDT